MLKQADADSRVGTIKPKEDGCISKILSALTEGSRYRWVHYLVIISLSTLSAFLLASSGWRLPALLDHLAVDAYFRVRGAQTPQAVAEGLPFTKDIVLVETDHIVPRTLQARLAARFSQAKVVAYDLMLEDHEAELKTAEKRWYRHDIQQWQQQDNLLSQQFHRLHTVVLGTWIDNEKTDQASQPGHNHVRYERQWVWQRPPLNLWQNAHYHAHLVVNPDDQDGVVRDVTLAQNVSPQAGKVDLIPSFGLALAAAAQGISPQQLAQQLYQWTTHPSYFQLGTRHIPVDATGHIAIDYVGGRECFDDDSNRIYYTAALDGYKPEDFRNKIVIIGETSRRSKEVMATPFGEMPAMAIHANVLATLLSPQGPPTLLPGWLTCLISLIYGAILVLPLVRWPLWGSLGLAAGEMGLLVLLGAGIFCCWHRVLPVSAPLLTICLTSNFIIVYEYWRTRQTLGQFIGSDMLPPTLQTLSRLRPGGQIEAASAMFGDLYGYSKLTEPLPIERASEFASAYMDVVTRVIHAHGGRVIDFVGDGVFALFDQGRLGEGFAMQSVAAALQLEVAIRLLGEKWGWHGEDALQVGIAIDTGPIMVGLVGGNSRLKLGAIGRPVNIACHVQSLTRQSGYNILLTQKTYEYVKAQMSASYYGRQILKGREQATELYGLTSSIRCAALSSALNEVSPVIKATPLHNSEAVLLAHQVDSAPDICAASTSTTGV